MALTDQEAVAYDAILEHICLGASKPFTKRCVCGWIGANHTKHLAHKVVEALNKKESKS